MVAFLQCEGSKYPVDTVDKAFKCLKEANEALAKPSGEYPLTCLSKVGIRGLGDAQ